MDRTTVELRAPWQSGLVPAIATWLAWVRHEYRVRRAAGSLMTLDDRQLADIGLNRSHAEYVARYGRLPGWVEEIRR